VTVTVPAACDPGGASPIMLHVTNGSPSTPMTVTIPSGCTITISVPSTGCAVTVSGAQTVGNGTTGTGGIAWTNGTGSAFSTATLNSPTVTAVSNGTGIGCPSAGTHTGGVLTGTYTVTSPTPAPGATVQP